MTTEKMIARKADGIGWMIFNNPERHNAVSLEMWERAIEIIAGTPAGWAPGAGSYIGTTERSQV